MSAAEIPTCTTVWPPAYARDDCALIWNAVAPVGLVMDGRSYKVTPSPRLRFHPGDWWHPLFRRARPGSDRLEDGPPRSDRDVTLKLVDHSSILCAVLERDRSPGRSGRGFGVRGRSHG